MKESEKREAFQYLWEHREETKTDEQFVREVIDSRLKYVPKKKLYKYRRCSKNNFKTLEENSIWMAPASSFPDAFDCTINIDFKRSAKDIEKWIEEEYPTYSYYLAQGICEKFGFDMPFTQEDINYYVMVCMDQEGNVDEAKEAEFLISHTKPDKLRETKNGLVLLKDFRKQFMKLEDQVADMLKDALEKVRTQPRDSQLIYCMAEHYDVGSLWENYADFYSGFCIEYSFERFYELPFEFYKNLAFLFPMTYRAKKPHFNLLPFLTGTMSQFFTNDIEWQNSSAINVDLNMQLYYKHKDYAYEHEWRFSIQNEGNNKQCFPFVSAIYAGKDIKPRNLARLRNIAKKLGVPVYQQTPNNANNGFDYILIEEVKV